MTDGTGAAQNPSQTPPPQTPPPQDVDTHHWDTVFAVSNTRINRAISKIGKLPKRIDFTDSSSMATQIHADFGTWQITNGGDGPLVNFALPMKNMTGQFTYQGTTIPFSCPDMICYVQIQLDFVDPKAGETILDADGKPMKDPPKGTTRKLLKPLKTKIDQIHPIASVQNIEYNQPLKPHNAHLAVSMALEDYVEQAIVSEDFDHIFAVIDLNDKVDTGDFAFCKPHKTSYGYSDKGAGQTGTEGFLGVLCMTTDEPEPTSHTLSNFAIPDGCEAAFIISPRRFLLDMTVPAICRAWPNMSSTDLEIDATNKILTLKDQTTIQLPDITHNGNQYTPNLTDLTVTIAGDTITMEAFIDMEVQPGVHATCASTYVYRIKPGTNKKGEQCLDYELVDHHKHPGTWSSAGAVAAKIALGVIGAIVSIVAMFLDPAVGLMLFVVVACFAIGSFVSTNNQLDNIDDAPGIGDLKASITKPIVWTGEKVFDIKTAGMAGALRLGGTWTS